LIPSPRKITENVTVRKRTRCHSKAKRTTITEKAPDNISPAAHSQTREKKGENESPPLSRPEKEKKLPAAWQTDPTAGKEGIGPTSKKT